MRKLLIVIFILINITLFANNGQANNERTLTFEQAANLAVAYSADLRHAYASQAVMEGAWKWGLRAYFPRVSIFVSENDRLQQIGSDSFMKNHGISVEQLVWDYRTSMSRKIERMEIDISSSRLDRMASEIAESAITAYRNVLSSRAILEIKIAALVVLEEQRRILNEEVQLGLALVTDLASADISLAETKLDIFSHQIDLTELEKQFAELIGLEYLPTLIETVDVNRSTIFPVPLAAAAIAMENNPGIVEARHSIAKKKMELNYISRSWIPTLRLNGNFAVSGQQYPLTRYNWSVGITIDLSTPWIQNRFSSQAGWEPPYDRTAMLQNSVTPLPEPAESYGVNQAALALTLEQDKYDTFLDQIGRIAANAVEKCILVAQKRNLALEAAALGSERARIEEIRLGLGHITRHRLMEIYIEQTQREIAVVQAATALLEAERELERLLDLDPGELAKFAMFGL